MPSEQFSNNAQTNLNGAITAGVTSLTVVSASGFPASAQFRIKIDNEIMIVTAGAGTTTWTVTRGAEGTTAAAHSDQATVTHLLTAAACDQFAQVSGGQLGGTGQAPDVRGLRETAGPTQLTMGAVADGEFLKRSGSTLVGSASAPPSGAAGGDLTGTYPNPSIGNNAVSDAKLRDSGACSVIGRSANSSGDPADISAGSNDTVLRRVSDAVGFGQLTVGMAPNSLWTYAKIEDVSATQRVLGRNTAGSGVVEEVTLSQLLDWVGSAAQGDILYRGAAGWSRLAAGTSGQFLKTQGTGADPQWATGSGGSSVDIYENGSSVVNGATRLDFKDANVENPSGTLADVYLDLPNLCGGRLTLTSGTPVTTSDVMAATTLYFTVFIHDKISLYDGTRWKKVAFTEQSIKLTDTQTGTTTNGSAVITGLTATSQLVRGMMVSGTGVGATATISSIDSASQVTLSVNSTASGSASITFKCPASKNYDVFGVLDSGALKLRFSNAWTNDTTRADALGDQNGKNNVNDAAINSGDSNSITAKQGLYLGTIRTTATDGQTDDSFGGASQAGGHRYVWNCYNQRPRAIGVIDTTNSWTYSTATWRQTNNASGNKVAFVCGLTETFVQAGAWSNAYSASDISPSSGIGIDSTTVNSAQTTGNWGPNAAHGRPSYARYYGYPGAGYHALNWLEISTAVGTTTWYGDNGKSYVQTGLLAMLDM